jgi:hypothetical protein
MMAPDERSSTGGTGSEVVGVVNYPDSGGAGKVTATRAAHPFALAGGSVFINPRTHLADTGKAHETSITTTDSSGFFRIENVLEGEHMIYIRDNSENAVAYIVSVPAEPRRIDVGTLFARKTSGVKIGYSGSAPDVLFFIDVRGTDMQLRCSSRNIQVTLDRIPTGVDHILTVRMFRPLIKGYDLTPINLVPDVISTLESITGE